MNYIKLGNTGMDVSRLCLGCMSFGDATTGFHPWVLDEEKSRPIIKKALELGINFFDTANIYSDGTSEEIVGKILKEYANRDEIVIATKLFNSMHPEPNRIGLSRKAIFTEIDKSLKRLKTDYVDLYQIHSWDYNTPIEETMEALHDVVKMGKVRYIGACNVEYSWQFLKAQHVAEKNGWTKFVSMQSHLSLLNREDERELLPLCKEEKVAYLPWSPLARGKLTRDWNEETARSETDLLTNVLYSEETAKADKLIVEKVAQIAEKRGASRAQIALAWVLQKETVTSPIIGSTKISHLEEAVKALNINLTEDEVKELEKYYVSHQSFSNIGKKFK